MADKSINRLTLAPHALSSGSSGYKPSTQGGIKLAKELAAADIRNHLFSGGLMGKYLDKLVVVCEGVEAALGRIENVQWGCYVQL